MSDSRPTIFIGETPLNHSDKSVQGEYVKLDGLEAEVFYKIHNFDEMEPFFMSIVSSSDHWLFISSTGSLSAGRISAEHALFPYYPVDRITENSENTGNKAILLVKRAGRSSIWEPLSSRFSDSYHIERNIYKNPSSTMVIFEESNLELGLTYRYAWRTSDTYGFVKTTWLINSGDSDCQVELLDGLQNILPTNITVATQLTFSSLIDAYKRSELEPSSGMAIFALNSTLTDLAEPSESLMATSVAQVGLQPANYLLSSIQLERFRQGHGIEQEIEIRGRRGAYFVHAMLELAANAIHTWHLFADVDQDSAAIALKIKELRGDQASLCQNIELDIAKNQINLRRIIASADGLQLTDSLPCANHHIANVMFNVMRGGIFADQYGIDVPDFISYLSVHNRPVLQENKEILAALPAKAQVSELRSLANASGSADLQRLGYSYLPLTFSRRHGDPSRPWNRFAINLKNSDGSLRLDYEGNWRVIFQNWEALAYSFPGYIENMLSTFLSATTADGYNPYRITYQGVDWELPEPSNPWANIGYWSDHQIIYLQKLMEISAKVYPGALQRMLDRPLFSYAEVPYRIMPYAQLLKDPFRTIIFDWDLEKKIEVRVLETGTDGKLIHASDGHVLQVSLTEKLLTLLLAKLANFVPEGGIWMNTQRPEWNDANNALVGKGLSVVTLCYLRRFIAFCKELFGESTLKDVAINAEVYHFYTQVSGVLNLYRYLLPGTFNDGQRREVMDALGNAGSEYRSNLYQNGFSGAKTRLAITEIVSFLDLIQAYVDHSLRANQRPDSLYHAYNIMHLDGEHAKIGHLYEMLEGQVAILSSGLLSDQESLALLRSLRHSSLYQEDQNSYILYPDRELPGFLQRNCIEETTVRDVSLLTKLLEANDKTLITRDINGIYHFNGQFHNTRDIKHALNLLGQDPRYANLVQAESAKIITLFEDIFHHDEFTGRSGTFFAYEGLGSIYWHMVSKLLLATQETIIRFKDGPLANELVERYFDIRAGLGFNKTPGKFGAFPTDPYSHTPKGQGAKQPGMTGQVKEEILTRMAELGLFIDNGQILFDQVLLNRDELLLEPGVFSWININGQPETLELPHGSLAYTFCQLPIALQASHTPQIKVFWSDGKTGMIDGQVLDENISRHIFMRDGSVHHLCVYFNR